jgi:hypothetical protein
MSYVYINGLISQTKVINTDRYLVNCLAEVAEDTDGESLQ